MPIAPETRTVLELFCEVRTRLLLVHFDEMARRVHGTIELTLQLLPVIQKLVDEDQAEVKLREKTVELFDERMVGQSADVILKIVTLHYYENANDLMRYTAEEPTAYYVYKIGHVQKGKACDIAVIGAYRDSIRFKEFLASIADYSDKAKATFLVPEKLEIKLSCRSLDFPELIHLSELSSHFIKNPLADSAEREQRLVLFRRVLKEYLKTHPPDQRLDILLANFPLVYESYTRDYQLWIGNSFGELEKAFEEKRLKFIADLNAILSGIQASILAVPIAALLLCDKFDFQSPWKNLFLAVAVSTMAGIALKLLGNQEATLEATRKAIDATKEDFEKKHNKRKVEFRTRLQNLDDQETRVRTLLKSLRKLIWSIAIISLGAWFISAAWPLMKASCVQRSEPASPPILNSAKGENTTTEAPGKLPEGVAPNEVEKQLPAN